MKMTLNHLLPKGLVILALLAGISLLSVAPAKATSVNYTITTGVLSGGTFKVDLVSGSFINWNLTTPVDTFIGLNGIPSSGSVLSNTSFTLLHFQTPNFLSINLNTANNSYSAVYTGGTGATNGSVQVPEAGTYLLLLAGLGMVGLAARHRKAAWF